MNTYKQSLPIKMKSSEIGKIAKALLEQKIDEQKEDPDFSINNIIPRLCLTDQVKQAAQELGYNIAETGLGLDGSKYIGNINWEQAMKLTLKSGFKPLSPWEFREFLLYLSKNNITMFEDFTKQTEPYRGVWIDAKFEKGQDELLYLLSNHELDSSGNLIPAYKEKLVANTLMKDKDPGINLMDWLKKNYTPQGLVSKHVAEGSLNSWYPRNGAVAWFVAGSGGVGFYCIWDPGSSDSGLGVAVQNI